MAAMDYVAPLDDFRFVLGDLLDLDGLTRFDQFAHGDLDTAMALLEESGRFHSEVIAPLNRVGDVEGSQWHPDGTVTTPTGFSDAYRRYCEAGWSGIQFDPEYGGGGLPWLIGLANAEITSSVNMAFALCPMLTHGAIEAVASHGSPEQKATYLENMITGRWTGTMNLTEPQAGSDLGAITTKAVPADDGSYRISGTKIFITWGEHDMAENIIHLVLARVPGAPPGTKGISLFLVPKFLINTDGTLGDRNDVRCVSIEHKLGIKASPTAVLSFGDSDGAIGYLVGEENAGMRYMFTMMNLARLTVGQEGAAVAEQAYQQALRFAQERTQGRAPGAAPGTASLIIEHPDVRRMLMTMKASIEAMRALLLLNAYSIDVAAASQDAVEQAAAEELVQILIPLSKAWVTEIGMEAVSTAIQVHGGMGFVEETGVAQHFRDLRIAPIYEGTNGIQAVDLVGRKLGMRQGRAVVEFVDGIAETAKKASASSDAQVAAMGARLSASVDSAIAATEYLQQADHADRLAGASPYLMLMGYLAGGWLMARSALVAAPRRDEDAFYEAKVNTAGFFVHQILPRTDGLLPAVVAGSRALFAVEEGQL